MPSLEVKDREFLLDLIWLVDCFPDEGSALAFHLPIVESSVWGRGAVIGRFGEDGLSCAAVVRLGYANIMMASPARCSISHGRTV